MDSDNIALITVANLARAAANHALDLEDRLRHSAAAWYQLHDLLRSIQDAMRSMQPELHN